VIHVSYENVPAFMRLFSPTLRMLMKAGSIVLLLLLHASLAEAAFPSPQGTSGVCDPHAATGRRLVRHPKSFGGPVKRPSQRTLVVLTEPTARLMRATHAGLGNDDEAIQNDAPAARTDAGDRPDPSLRPLGLLTGAVQRLPRARTFSPKSPRGPPVSA
jgi:hypothetical protein